MYPDYLLLHGKLPKNILALSSIHLFAHKSAIWTGLRGDSSSLLHTARRLTWGLEEPLCRWHISGKLVGLLTRSSAGALASGSCFLSVGCLGFFPAWWLGSKGECPKRTRKKLYCLVWPRLVSHITWFLLSSQACLHSSGRNINPISWWEEYQSHVIRMPYGKWIIVAVFRKYNLPHCTS